MESVDKAGKGCSGWLTITGWAGEAMPNFGKRQMDMENIRP